MKNKISRFIMVHYLLLATFYTFLYDTLYKTLQRFLILINNMYSTKNRDLNCNLIALLLTYEKIFIGKIIFFGSKYKHRLLEKKRNSRYIHIINACYIQNDFTFLHRIIMFFQVAISLHFSWDLEFFFVKQYFFISEIIYYSSVISNFL